MSADCEFESMKYVDEQSIDPNLICIICSKPFKDPVCSPCDHTYGRQCLTEWLVKKKKNSCPTCNHAPISMDGLTQASRPLRNMLDAIRVECLLCDRTNMQRGSFLDHISKTCPRATVSCVAADIRCPWRGLREELDNHTSTCIFEPLRPVLASLIAENHQLHKQVQRHDRVIRQLAEQMVGAQATPIHISDDENETATAAESATSDVRERQENAIFVRNLPAGITFKEAFDLFSKAGRIQYDTAAQKSSLIIMRPSNQQGSCNARVTYVNVASAKNAVLQYNDKQIPGWNTRLQVQISYPPKRNDKNAAKPASGNNNPSQSDKSTDWRKKLAPQHVATPSPTGREEKVLVTGSPQPLMPPENRKKNASPEEDGAST